MSRIGQAFEFLFRRPSVVEMYREHLRALSNLPPGSDEADAAISRLIRRRESGVKDCIVDDEWSIDYRNPHWENKMSALSDGQRVCSVCHLCVDIDELTDHEFSCWKREISNE